MLKKLKENRGSGSVYGLAFALFVLLVFSVGYIYIKDIYLTAYVKNTAGNVLDKYTTECGELAESNLKSGSNFTVTLNSTAYKEKLIEALGIRNADGIAYDRENRIKLKIDDITLDCVTDEQLITTAKIEIQIPIYYSRGDVFAVPGVITVTSKYNLK